MFIWPFPDKKFNAFCFSFIIDEIVEIFPSSSGCFYLNAQQKYGNRERLNKGNRMTLDAKNI